MGIIAGHRTDHARVEKLANTLQCGNPFPRYIIAKVYNSIHQGTIFSLLHYIFQTSQFY